MVIKKDTLRENNVHQNVFSFMHREIADVDNTDNVKQVAEALWKMSYKNVSSEMFLVI